jgi:hypothetical protein
MVLSGNALKGRPRRTFLDQIRQVLEKGQVKSIRIRRTCLRSLMKVEEARNVCKYRSKWKEVISTPTENRRDVMYVCINWYFTFKVNT